MRNSHFNVDFPGLRRGGSWSQIIDQAQDFPEQFPRHRHLGQLERDVAAKRDAPGEEIDFATMVLENLKTSGVQQAAKEDRIGFSTLAPWPGKFIAAEGRYQEGEDGPDNRPSPSAQSRSDITAKVSPAHQ